jgi:hypothetical protein
VDWVYMLCSAGHIFPDAAPIIHHSAYLKTDARQHIDRWNMIATIGAQASGKTYLLLRMLGQDLDHISDLGPRDGDGRVEFRYLSPLERVPMAVRSAWYEETRSRGEPMPATNLDSAMPAGIFEQQLPQALEAIRELIRRTVADGDRRAADWGTTFRQPLVLRSDTRGQRTWTGLADLPGELFLPNSPHTRQQVKLRDYDGLIWVLDPAVAADALDPMVQDEIIGTVSYADVIDGSLRPGATAGVGADFVRTVRDQSQVEIGEHLALLEGPMTANSGPPLDLMVAISKCDLIHAALGTKNLNNLGDPGDVANGVAGYLGHLIRRRERRGAQDADPDADHLIQYMYGSSAVEESVRTRRIRQIAEGLIEHYSQPVAFWNLVHDGGADPITIPAAGDPDNARQLWRMTVPSIADHLEQACLPGAADRLHLRDLIMSAVGCGIAYGLGYSAPIYRLLQNDWMNLTFFLCSPLSKVPVKIEGDLITPLSGGRFPRVQERSAALTQLLLVSLRKARR